VFSKLAAWRAWAPGKEIRAIAVDADARLLVSARAPTDLAGLDLPVLSGRDLDPHARPDGVAAHKSRPHDVALILYADDAAVLRSSRHSHASLLAQAEADEQWLGVGEGERFWSTVDEGVAASVSVLLAAWRKGAEIVIVDCELDVREQLDLLDRFQPAVVWFADEEYGLLASAAPPARAEAISIRRALTSNDPGEGAAAFERVFGAEVARARASDGIGIAQAQHAPKAVSERSAESQPEVRQTKRDTGPTVGTRTAAHSAKAVTPITAEPAVNEPSVSPAPKPNRAVPKREPVLETASGSETVGIARRPAESRRPSALAAHVRRVVIGVAHMARALTHELARLAVALARPLPRAAAALMRSAVRAVRLLARLVFRAARDLAPVLLRATAGLRRLLGLAVHAVQRFARFVLRAVRDLALLLPRARAAPKRSSTPVRRGGDQREEGQAAALVMAWVRPRAEPSEEPSAEPGDEAGAEAGKFASVDHHADAVTRESDVVTLQPPSPEHQSDRVSRRPRAGVALSVAVAAILSLTLVLVVYRHRGVSATQRQPTTAEALSSAEAAVPVRTAYSNPRAYAAAMTRLSLRSGGTEIDGTPTCNADSTWERWTCRARGKPTLGAYAGRWLTYRCSPSHIPQPNGSPAGLVIGCRPVNPPSLTT
jgi:hypothetical protein